MLTSIPYLDSREAGMPATTDRINCIAEYALQVAQNNAYMFWEDDPNSRLKYGAKYAVGLTVISITISDTDRKRDKTVELDIDEPVFKQADTPLDINEQAMPGLMKHSYYMFGSHGLRRRYYTEDLDISYWLERKGRAYQLPLDATMLGMDQTEADDAKGQREHKLLEEMAGNDYLSQAECEYLVQLMGLYDPAIAVPLDPAAIALTT